MKFDVYRRQTSCNGGQHPAIKTWAVLKTHMENDGCTQCPLHAMQNINQSPRVNRGKYELWPFPSDRNPTVVFSCVDGNVEVDLPNGVEDEQIKAVLDPIAAEMKRLMPYYQWTAKQLTDAKKASDDRHKELVARLESAERVFAELQKKAVSKSDFDGLQRSVATDNMTNKTRFDHYTKHIKEHHDGNWFTRLFKRKRAKRTGDFYIPESSQAVAEREANDAVEQIIADWKTE